jgi:hypothetical protein
MSNIIMDNWSINLCSKSKEQFDLGMKMAFEANCPGGKVEYYAITEDNRTMILMWGDRHKEGNSIWSVCERDITNEIKVKIKRFPHPMQVDIAIGFVWQWVMSEANQGEESWSSDVWREKGYRLHTDYWGHTFGSPYGVIAITGEHALIGK